MAQAGASESEEEKKMTRTLTVTVEDPDKSGSISISGTLQQDKFNELIVLSIGQAKIALNSQDLASALKAVVDFQQTQTKPSIVIPSGTNLDEDAPLFRSLLTDGRF